MAACSLTSEIMCMSAEFANDMLAANGKLEYVTSSIPSCSAASRLDFRRRRLCVLYAVSYSSHSTCSWLSVNLIPVPLSLTSLLMLSCLSIHHCHHP